MVKQEELRQKVKKMLDIYLTLLYYQCYKKIEEETG